MPSAIGFQRTLSRLMRIPNQSATGVLEEGVLGPSLGVRSGTIAAWAGRSDEPSQHRFLANFSELTDGEVSALRDLPRKFRRTLRLALRNHETESCLAAIGFLLRCRAFDEFPALVEAATDPDHPCGQALAEATLELAQALHNAIIVYRESPSGRDPSFARRWALTSLVTAVDRFSKHGHIELAEAFLLVTTPENPTLTRLLSDATHPCHQPLAESLRTSCSHGAVGLLAAMFEDPKSPLLLLEIAAERKDVYYRNHLLEAMGYPVSPRALESVARVRQLAWLKNLEEDCWELPPKQQAAAVQLAMASRLSRRNKLALLQAFLQRGAPLARYAACECLPMIELPEAIKRLEELLEENDPQLVAIAADKLRRTGFTGAVPHLARLLEHPDAAVRATAQSALHDFTFLRYVALFDDLNDSVRSELGRIVVRSDSTTLEQVQAELKAATLRRKVRGLQMTAAMEITDQLLAKVIELAEHKDAEVRCEALGALAVSYSQEAREVIEQRLSDPNASVVKRARAALAQLDATSLHERRPEV